jgi:filamentous hemagglutinin
MCEKGGGLGGVFGGQTGNSLPAGSSQLSHIFGDRPGHLPDTPHNRQSIVDLVNDESYRLGTDSRGLTWYARILSDGTQLWASVRNGVVQNCGKNDPPRPWDDETGLSNNINKSTRNIFKKRGK